MHLLTRTLATATLLGAIATTGFAQTTPAPAPAATATHPNTKVYSYKKTAPPNAGSPSHSASSSQMTRDPDVPSFGSKEWWADKNRYGHGDGGGGP